MRQTLSEYSTRVLKGWWALIVAAISDVIGIALTKQQDWSVPNWLWWVIILAGFAIAQFLAYHAVRQERDAIRSRLESVAGASIENPEIPRTVMHLEPEDYYEFGRPGDDEFKKIKLKKEARLIRWSLSFTSSTHVIIETMSLKLSGKMSPYSDWKSYEFQGGTMHFSVTFELPEGINAGIHTAQVVAFADNRPIGHTPVKIEIPAESEFGKSAYRIVKV